MVTIEDFVMFLYEHNVYETYLDECMKMRWRTHEGEVPREYMIAFLWDLDWRKDKRNMMIGGFDWESSERGDDFWRGLNVEWVKMCK